MMMPANYSVIAENELSYVEGGASFIDWVGDRTATVWNAANVKTFNTNVVTIVGNAFVDNMSTALWAMSSAATLLGRALAMLSRASSLLRTRTSATLLLILWAMLLLFTCWATPLLLTRLAT